MKKEGARKPRGAAGRQRAAAIASRTATRQQMIDADKRTEAPHRDIIQSTLKGDGDGDGDDRRSDEEEDEQRSPLLVHTS